MTWQNLDLDCAVAASGIVEKQRAKRTAKQDMESLLTNAAAVLADNGPYALFLYLWSRQSKPPQGVALDVMREMYNHLDTSLAWKAPTADGPAILAKVAAATRNFDSLALLRRVLIQTLAYLRYHAKTLEDKPKKAKAVKV
jgi:hypothetical protein